jgi:hyperosmotically inducible periplasmic protein
MARHLVLIAVSALALAACSDTPAPKPAAKPAPPPVAEAPPPAAVPAPAPTPITKAPEAPKPDPNKELAERVKRALEGEAKIQAAGIDVTAADGTVTLWGTAATAAERERAARAAGKIDGVKSVQNKIAVVKGS